MDRHEVETHLVGDFDDTSLHELANREFPCRQLFCLLPPMPGVVPPGLVKVAKITDSVEDALRMCASASFGAVFCDAASLANGGSGFRLGRQMRRNGIATPLFLMTNSLLSGMEGMAVASGATGFISRTAAANSRCAQVGCDGGRPIRRARPESGGENRSASSRN